MTVRIVWSNQLQRELEKELSHIKWDILGTSEHKHTGDQLTAFRGEKTKEDIVGFLIHIKHAANIMKLQSVGPRKIY